MLESLSLIILLVNCGRLHFMTLNISRIDIMIMGQCLVPYLLRL